MLGNGFGKEVDVLVIKHLKNKALPNLCNWLEREKRVIVTVDELIRIMSSDVSKSTVFDSIASELSSQDIQVEKIGEQLREVNYGFCVEELEDKSLVTCGILCKEDKTIRPLNNNERKVAQSLNIKYVRARRF